MKKLITIHLLKILVHKKVLQEDIKMRQKVFSIIIAGVLLSSVSFGYSGGSGEPNDPYQIGSTTDLFALAADTNDYNKCFILTANIDLAPNLPGGQVFTTALIAPDISPDFYFQGTAFTGTFDGNSHKITNLTINTNSAGNSYLGLFGYIDYGEVKNLGLENVSVTDGNDSEHLGGLAGWNARGTISNCYSTGAVTSGDGAYWLGGLLGESDYSNINNCYSTGTVTCGDNSYHIGGLVGGSWWGNISDCRSTGAVVTGDSSCQVAGLTGDNGGGTINNCFSSGAVIGGDYSWCFGGLVGWNAYSGTISNCFSTDDVANGIAPTTYYLCGYGGLVGANAGPIRNCFSTGDVTGGHRSGGLVGDNVDTIHDCYSTGAVTGRNWAVSIGGLVGTNEGSTRISNCHSTGIVSGSSQLGGLVGESFPDSIISNCYFLVTSGPDNGLGTPLTDEQMKQQNSFVGWDFVGETINGPNDVWTIKETADYPKLVWVQVNLVSSRFPLGWYEVDFADFAAMANWWGHSDCATNNDCDVADFDFSGTVDVADLVIFTQHWLE